MPRGQPALAIAFVAALAVAPAASASPAQRLVFDASGGVLRDANGHRLGTFHEACTAAERCAGSALTADGRLRFRGTGSATAPAFTWRLTGTSGRYRGARGTLTLRVVSDTEWVAAATVRTRAALRAGKEPALGANRGFARHADRACVAASHQLAALPAFPFAGFDPLHPDPSLLPQVGAFFTGPGDPRPTLHLLVTKLHALGTPAAATAWMLVLRAEDGGITVRDEQDTAALAADVPAFVRSVEDTVAAERRLALAADVFGATRCA
jgi:hypothetical protein